MATEWKKVKLGELYEVHNGLSKGGKFFGSGYPFLSFSTIFNNFFIPENIKDLVQSTSEEQENYSVKAGDVFVTRTSETADELGMSCVALKDYPNATYNGFCKRLRPIDSEYKVLPKYIGYYLRTPEFRGKFLGLSGSMTTRASLKNDDLLSMTIPLPSLETQQKIAGILSAYDDLIENNRKQIKLLEEAAQKLYKEWFVKLNFPGHENVKIVDGVPEGWTTKTVEELGEYLNGYAFKPSDWKTEGLPIIKIKEMNQGITKDTPRNSGEQIPKKYIIKTGDIVFSWSATLAVVIWTGETGLLNQHLFKVTPATSICREFIFQTIKYELDAFSNLTTGATMKHIQRNKLSQLSLAVPDKKIMSLYDKVVNPIREKIINSQLSILNLQSARDKLLPKLMNGEVEV